MYVKHNNNYVFLPPLHVVLVPCFVQTDLAGIAKWLVSPLPLSVPKTLIFTQTKNVTCKVYEWLSQCATIKSCVNMYHASLTHTTKAHIQDELSSHQAVSCVYTDLWHGR